MGKRSKNHGMEVSERTQLTTTRGSPRGSDKQQYLETGIALQLRSPKATSTSDQAAYSAKESYMDYYLLSLFELKSGVTEHTTLDTLWEAFERG